MEKFVTLIIEGWEYISNRMYLFVDTKEVLQSLQASENAFVALKDRASGPKINYKEIMTEINVLFDQVTTALSTAEKMELDQEERAAA